MKKDFKQWKDDYGLEFEPNYSKETELDCKAAFEAGQKSKQAEVDDLKKRIDEVIYDLQHIESAIWEEQVEHVLRILKGNKNDH